MGTLCACAVRVPCSTSNLGAGFDCIGLAFSTYLDAGFEPDAEPLRITRAGTLRNLDIPVDDDVIAIAFRSELARRGIREVTGRLLVTSQVPVGRGLGSSGAAVVAGIALAAGACGDALDRDTALPVATRVEGHPDNSAPSLYGGLVAVAFGDHATPRAMHLPLSPAVRFVFAAPDVEVSTQRARAALPQHVPHSAASRNLGRVAALLHGLANADADAIALGFADELHVPYRLPLIPGARQAIDAAHEAGAWATTISGSGSGLIAACADGAEDAVLGALTQAFTQAGQRAAGFVARPDMRGAQPRDFGTLRDALRSAS